MRIAGVCLGEGALVLGLQPVVQFHLGALDHLVDHALDVGAGGELLEHTDHALHGLQIGTQRLVGAGVLDLDRHVAAVVPHRPVHLPDAGRGHRCVVKRIEPGAPLGAQLPVEHAVHLRRRQRRGVLLQLGQRLAVGLAELLGHRGLHHRQCLADLHRAALELAEDGEQLIGGLLHQLGVDLVARLPGQSLSEAQRGPARKADRNAGQLRVAGGSPAPDVCHAPHHPRRFGTGNHRCQHWQRGCLDQRRARIVLLLTSTSRVVFRVDGGGPGESGPRTAVMIRCS